VGEQKNDGDVRYSNTSYFQTDGGGQWFWTDSERGKTRKFDCKKWPPGVNRMSRGGPSRFKVWMVLSLEISVVVMFWWVGGVGGG